MSRLDAIAAYFGGDTNQAKSFTRAVRGEFEAAPSYAEILEAIRRCPAKVPSVQQVVAEIKKHHLANGSPAAGGRGVPVPQRGQSPKRGATRAPRPPRPPRRSNG